MVGTCRVVASPSIVVWAFWIVVVLQTGCGSGGHEPKLPLPAAEIAVPRGASFLTVGPDQNVWYAVSQDGQFGFIAPDGTVTEFQYGGLGSFTGGIAAGSDGNLWLTEIGQSEIVKATLTGTATNRYVPTNRGGPQGIVLGPDGNIWFTEAGRYSDPTYKIGRVSPSFEFAEFPVPSGAVPQQIAVGADGNLWFTEISDGIGRITPSGTVTEFSTPTKDQFIKGITNGPDGALWFVSDTPDHTRAIVGRITTEGSVTRFLLPDGRCSPVAIVAGPDGNLWFTETGAANAIGRITPNGAVTEFAVATDSGWLPSIIVGPDGELWFSDPLASKVWHFKPGDL